MTVGVEGERLRLYSKGTGGVGVVVSRLSGFQTRVLVSVSLHSLTVVGLTLGLSLDFEFPFSKVYLKSLEVTPLYPPWLIYLIP